MDKFTLVIGNKNYSSWSLRPWLMLRHFQISFKEILIPLAQPDSKQKILSYSPAGKVPILIHNELVVWESIAIGEYLADLFPGKNLWPAHKQARAVARAISAEMHAGFLNLRKACPMNIKQDKPLEQMTPEIEKDVRRITNLWEDCRKRFGKNRKFLFGDFSIADAMFGPIIWRFNSYGIKTTGGAKDYFEAMLNLPAMKEWKEAALKETWVIEHH